MTVQQPARGATGIRVAAASVDDSSKVLGMNRLRAAYLEIDPSLEPPAVLCRDELAGEGSWSDAEGAATVVLARCSSFP